MVESFVYYHIMFYAVYWVNAMRLSLAWIVYNYVL